MKFIAIAGLIALTASAAQAAPEEVVIATIDAPIPADGLELDQFKWIARPVVVFADSPFDPAFTEQIDLLTARMAEMIERDVVVIFDADPAARSAIRTQLRPRGFSIVLIDKEGKVNLRKPFPWDVRELSRAIDKMPQRQQEIREKRSISPD